VHDAVAVAVVPAVGAAALVVLALTSVGAIRAPGMVPVDRLLAFRLVNPAPLPVNEFPALLNVTAFA
jgi:hypothetical protein